MNSHFSGRDHKPVTIRQVAALAGVSTQTVSRVINRRPDVAPDTRRRVQQVIDALSYTPNAIARSLISGRSQTLAVVAYGLEFFGPAHLLSGIVKQAREQNYSLRLNILADPLDNCDAVLNDVLTRQVDGVIWAVPEIGNNRAWLNDCLPRFTAPVVFTSMQPLPGLSVIAVDNRLGARLAVRHLLQQGYRQVGVITGPMDWWETRQRLEGWRDAINEAGLEASDRLIAYGDWSAASGQSGLQQLLKQSPRLDAVLTGNDQMALGVLQAAEVLGRSVPATLGVVGFDDIPEAPYFIPPLTTVQQRLADMGRKAVEMLSSMLSAENTQEPFSGQVVWLDPELVVRSSSNPHYQPKKEFLKGE
jgi:LacI family transcriptional regulator